MSGNPERLGIVGPGNGGAGYLGRLIQVEDLRGPRNLLDVESTPNHSV